jgi:hypothetical protein
VADGLIDFRAAAVTSATNDAFGVLCARYLVPAADERLS